MMRLLSVRNLLALALGAAASTAGAAVPEDAATSALIGRLIVGGGAVLVVLATLYYCIRCFRRPGERDPGHIKHRILNDDWCGEEVEPDE